MRIESTSEVVAMSAQHQQKQKPSKASKETRVCSLGQPGHTDERCYTRIRKEERELASKYRELMKKQTETAHLTTVKSALNQDTWSEPKFLSALPITPSYYNEAYAVGNQDQSVVTLDTACSSHMFGNRQYLQQMRSMPPSPIQVASKTGGISAREQGIAILGQLRLDTVIYSPELSANLVLAGMLYDDGYDIIWSAHAAEIYSPDGSHLLTFHWNSRNSRLCQIQVSPPIALKAFATSADSTAVAGLWNRRLGHLHPSGVIQYLKSAGLSAPSLKDFTFCDTCAMGKTIRTRSTHPFRRTDRVLACIHSDIMGPIAPTSLGGKRYNVIHRWLHTIQFHLSPKIKIRCI